MMRVDRWMASSNASLKIKRIDTLGGHSNTDCLKHQSAVVERVTAIALAASHHRAAECLQLFARESGLRLWGRSVDRENRPCFIWPICAES